ncbi:MAG: hypothetical protein LIP03_16235 [Bacteroidales bacterium]|nr:hypothetical protein [Bacteroidales bacterium]
MRKLAFSLLLLLCAYSAVVAQSQDRPALSNEDRAKWLSEMRNFKHDYLTRELALSKEQQDAFFPVYDAMDDEIMAIANETRDLENQAESNPEASDVEIETAAQALFQQKSREGEVEARYFEQFKEILTPKQLLRLKNAERKFTTQLVKHHGKQKTDGPRRKQ